MLTSVAQATNSSASRCLSAKRTVGSEADGGWFAATRVDEVVHQLASNARERPTFHNRSFREQAVAPNYAAKTECKVCFAPMSGHRETQLPNSKVPIGLKTPSLTNERFFWDRWCVVHATSSCDDVRNHIVSHRSDHRPPYRSSRALQRRRPGSCGLLRHDHKEMAS